MPQLQGAAWQALQAAALVRAQGRCEVTAAPLGAPAAALAPRWGWDDGAHVLRLEGFQLEAPEVRRVGALLALEREDAAAAATAADLLRQLNCWSEDDAQAYLGRVRQVAVAQHGGGAWRLDLRLLQARGIQVPARLVGMCV